MYTFDDVGTLGATFGASKAFHIDSFFPALCVLKQIEVVNLKSSRFLTQWQNNIDRPITTIIRKKQFEQIFVKGRRFAC